MTRKPYEKPIVLAAYRCNLYIGPAKFKRDSTLWHMEQARKLLKAGYPSTALFRSYDLARS